MRNKANTQDIVVLYTVRHLTLRQIASLVGMSAVAVGKRLRTAGITADQGEWVDEICSLCGNPVKIQRSRWLISARHYCGEQCYHKSRENQDYRPWREGQYIARSIVARLFELQPQHIVHHVDGDNTNNDRVNLWVFSSQGDHMKHHHGVSPVEPIWKG